MKVEPKHLCGVAGLLLVVGLAGVAAAATNVCLKKQVTTSTTVVRLGDVADVASDDDQRGRQLAKVPLMPAPAPGTQRFLQKREVQDLLAAHGEDIRQLQFGGEERVEVAAPAGWTPSGTRDADDPTGRRAALEAGQVVRREVATHDTAKLDAKQSGALREQLRQLLVSYVASKTGNTHGLRVTFDISDRYLAMLAAAKSTPVCRGGDEPWTGHQRFAISLSTGDGAVQIPIYADVTVATPAVVATHAIANGSVITAADVELRQVDNLPVATDRRAQVESVEKIIGMEAVRAIQVGDVVQSDQVRAPLLVKRGEQVTVTTQGGGIRVRTTARVRQDGTRGELVQVESIDTKEKYDARVIGVREVAVLAPSAPVVARTPREPTETRWR